MQNILGQVIGDYQVLDPIDNGGVADVFRAKSNKDGQLAALKIIKPDMVDVEQLTQRFLQEAEMMASLSHPHIIKIIKTDFYQNRPYILLQYAAKGSLNAHVGKLSLAEIGRILQQVASALDYAHARNTIHRDIKLENVLLDEQANALLIDFGMAKSLEQNTLSTSTGVLLGTPMYLSPEQCMFEPVDARSDVYSLGVLAFVLLTGDFPFKGRAPADIMTKHLRQAPPLIIEFKPELSKELALVVDKTLAKQPSERYQSAGEFAAAFLAAIGQDTSVSPDKAKKSLPPALIFFLALIIVVLIAMAFVAMFLMLPA
jgi:eukaryotic-like serine/threonine-protein kinase